MERTNQDGAEHLDETLPAAQRMKAYIDAHIREPLTAKSLADAAGYSQYHAARLFKRHFGQMPFEYIRERRLIKAAQALRSGGYKVSPLPGEPDGQLKPRAPPPFR